MGLGLCPGYTLSIRDLDDQAKRADIFEFSTPDCGPGPFEFASKLPTRNAVVRTTTRARLITLEIPWRRRALHLVRQLFSTLGSRSAHSMPTKQTRLRTLGSRETAFVMIQRAAFFFLVDLQAAGNIGSQFQQHGSPWSNRKLGEIQLSVRVAIEPATWRPTFEENVLCTRGCPPAIVTGRTSLHATRNPAPVKCRIHET